MKFTHVFLTWLVTNLLHPVLFIGGSLVLGEGLIETGEIILLCTQIFVYSIFFSLPSLFIAYALAIFILKQKINDHQKFLAWLILASTIPALNWVGLIIFFNLGDILEDGLLLMMLPSVGAVFLSILVRYNFFTKLLQKIKEQETRFVLEGENDQQ